MITANGIFKYAEVDDFNQGCIGPSHDAHISVSFNGATVDDVIRQACAFVGVAEKDIADSVERNVCDETGRVDIARTETDDGVELTTAQIEAWKSGHLRAWYCVYTIYLQQCAPVAA